MAYANLNNVLVDALIAAGSPPIISGYRNPKRNRRAGGVPKSMHLQGKAADIDMSGMTIPERIELMNTLAANGITRFGAYSNSNTLHVDLSTAQGDFHKMFDKTVENIHKAPEYFRNWQPGGDIQASAVAGAPEVYGGEVAPVSGERDMPNPLVQQMIQSAMSGQIGTQLSAPTFPQEPESLAQSMAANPFLQMGLNIMGTGDIGLGGAKGINDAAAAENKAKAVQAEMAARLAYSQRGTLKDPRTANIKDIQELQRLKSIAEASGNPKDMERYLEAKDVILSQKASGYERNRAKEIDEGKKFGDRVDEAARQISLSKRVVFQKEMMADKLRQAFKLSGSVGWPQLFSWVKGSEPAQLEDLMKSITSPLVIDKMMEMKAASAQGATGFGNLTEKELDLLINNLVSVDLRNPSTFKDRMTEIMVQYNRVEEAARKDYQASLAFYRANNPLRANPLQRKFEDTIPNYYKHLEKAKTDIRSPREGAPRLQRIQ